MASAPSKCPMCGESIQWKKVDTSKKGFSVGKAAAGAERLLEGGAGADRRKTGVWLALRLGVS